MRRPAYFFTHLDGSFDRFAELLAGSPSEWLPEPVTVLGPHRYSIELRADDLLPTVEAETTVPDPAISPSSELVVRPLEWHARHAASLFPVLSGDLELELLTTEMVRLSFAGSYRPPLSVVGEAADRVAGRHVAEATIRRFVLDVAARLGQTTTVAP